VIELAAHTEPRLLRGMLNLLRADDADLVVATRHAVDDPIISPDHDHEFVARLAKWLIRLTHVEDLQSLTGQFVMRRQLITDIRNLSGLRFKVLLDLLLKGERPWRIIQLPLNGP
jgi:hypothetical protein